MSKQSSMTLEKALDRIKDLESLLREALKEMDSLWDSLGLETGTYYEGSKNKVADKIRNDLNG